MRIDRESHEYRQQIKFLRDKAKNNPAMKYSCMQQRLLLTNVIDAEQHRQ